MSSSAAEVMTAPSSGCLVPPDSCNSEPTIVIPTGTGCDYFARNTAQRREIIERLIREQQLVAFAGPYGVGKSPALADIGMHVLNGVAWCGRTAEKRPVIHIDLETPGPVYKANLRNIAARLNLSLPKVPPELDVYLEHDDLTEEGTKKLLAALAESKPEARFKFIEEALDEKPDALVIIDPLELLFRIDTGKKQHVLWLYTELRQLLSRYQHAAMLITFNLRKQDRQRPYRPDLLKDPRTWLEEVCGTLDILNRSDVRLGMDAAIHDEEVRVINGIRRGEDMQPLVIRSVDTNGMSAITGDNLAGFELCPPNTSNLKAVFTPKQLEYWNKLPPTFRFKDVADKSVPRASLQRLLDHAKSLGIIEKDGNDNWQKKAN